LRHDLMPDKNLVDLILKGDRQAFVWVIRRTERLVTQIVHRMVSDPEARKDIMQEVYLKAWQHLPGFRQEAKLSTWIARIAYNNSVDVLRQKQGNQGWSEMPDVVGDENADTIILDRELADVLRKGLDMLPPIYRTVIVLYHQEDQSYEDIVRITGLPMGTVKNYLFRARKRLGELVRSQYKIEIK
jgi:RNA polymerase sigma factor (sigma-70 family)